MGYISYVYFSHTFYQDHASLINLFLLINRKLNIGVWLKVEDLPNQNIMKIKNIIKNTLIVKGQGFEPD